jgi:hypothetical protein
MLRRVAAQVATRPGATGPIWGLNDLDSRLIRAIWNVSGGHPDESLKNEAFVAAQRLHETQAGAALTLMSARFAAGNDAVAAVVRRQQDLKATLDSLDKRITSELGAPDGKRNDALVVSLRTETSRAQKSLDETTAQISRELPGYAELESGAADDGSNAGLAEAGRSAAVISRHERSELCLRRDPRKLRHAGDKTTRQ